MPHAKKEINPLWGLLAEPLFQIVAAVGLLLSGVLGLVGKLLGPILGPLVCFNHSSSQSIDHLANNVFSLTVLVLVVCSMVFSEVLASRRSSAALVLVTSLAQSPVRNKQLLMID
jgi:uncharacterized membrane protein YeaQ/YmgE (transglycosylase-associated protein family)